MMEDLINYINNSHFKKYKIFKKAFKREWTKDNIKEASFKVYIEYLQNNIFYMNKINKK